MAQVERILCPLDFSEFSAKAYDYALSLAQHYRARLIVQHIVELWHYPYANSASARVFDEFSHKLGAAASEQLQEFVKNHTRDGIQPECVVQQGWATDSILSFAREQAINSIVMGTHGRRGFDRLMLGSVTERVLREAPCPVLVVHKPSHDFVAAGKSPDSVELRRVLFCTDFSEASDRGLEYALSLVAEYDADLTLVHVLEGILKSGAVDKRIAKALERLDRLVPPEARKAHRIKTAVRVGSAYQEIIQLASEIQADMVVMAVQGRNALDIAVFGSTTYRVIQLGTCPVLAVTFSSIGRSGVVGNTQ